jgi:hypothetical protein
MIEQLFLEAKTVPDKTIELSLVKKRILSTKADEGRNILAETRTKEALYSISAATRMAFASDWSKSLGGFLRFGWLD